MRQISEKDILIFLKKESEEFVTNNFAMDGKPLKTFCELEGILLKLLEKMFYFGLYRGKETDASSYNVH